MSDEKNVPERKQTAAPHPAASGENKSEKPPRKRPPRKRNPKKRGQKTPRKPIELYKATPEEMADESPIPVTGFEGLDVSD